MTKQTSKMDQEKYDSIVEFPNDATKFDELRQLLFGLSKPELERLQAWVQQPGIFVDELSTQLPQAISNMIKNEEISIETLVPFIEQAIQESIKKQPQRLIDILFPVMMPAIRKAVAESISNLVLSLNDTLEKSFSPKRYFWRFQAMFSHKSYAEIVLSNAYVYHVKHVFLIHKETGLMLNQISDGQGATQDGDLVSAMLTAIKDFVQDSLNFEGEKILDTIQISGYNIWIEQGPHAIIAGIVEGNPPKTTRELFKQSIENIHLNYSYYLQKFDGDVSPFIPCEKELSPCLQKEKKEKKKRPPYILILILIGILGCLGYWSFYRVEAHYRWGNYKAALTNIPGLIITATDYHRGKYEISGLIDPFGPDPLMKLEQFGFNDSLVSSKWIRYNSMEKQYTLERANYYLHPPKSIVLSFSDGILYVQGRADDEWIAKAKILYRTIFGIQSIDFTGVANTVAEKIDFNTESIESYFFEFPYNTIEMNQKQHESFDSLILEIQRIIKLALQNDQYAIVKVLSYTSYKGNADGNEKIAYDRALEFIRFMTQAGVQREILFPEVIFVEDQNVDFNIRTVSFKVILKQNI
ncbi:MAG: hypothetical protein JEZ03_13840 [Bacteroidales bacterium]|nr:hypothetical protein [Bacteroidales bacterium]